ncbi:unnamed protein product, partial [Polarella glacialis]
MVAVGAIINAKKKKKASQASQVGNDVKKPPRKLKLKQSPSGLPSAPVQGSGVWKYQRQAALLYSDMNVQLGVAGLIAGNFVCNVIEKQIDPKGIEYPEAFGGFELFFNIVFTAELALNMYAYWWRTFWSS